MPRCRISRVWDRIGPLASPALNEGTGPSEVARRRRALLHLIRDGQGRDIDQMWRSLDSAAGRWERGTVEATASGLFKDGIYKLSGPASAAARLGRGPFTRSPQPA